MTPYAFGRIKTCNLFLCQNTLFTLTSSGSVTTRLSGMTQEGRWLKPVDGLKKLENLSEDFDFANIRDCHRSLRDRCGGGG